MSDGQPLKRGEPSLEARWFAKTLAVCKINNENISAAIRQRLPPARRLPTFLHRSTSGRTFRSLATRPRLLTCRCGAVFWGNFTHPDSLREGFGQPCEWCVALTAR